MRLTKSEIRSFQRIVYTFYRAHGRRLPWRGKNKTKYHVLVSEIMLQQTQVSRVVGRYPQFLIAFPNLRALAAAPVRDVLRVWHGMGYNRRALMLKRLAEIVARDYGGKIPSDAALLKKLPGIGEATAASIGAFAFNQPTVFIETNIRTVFIHHFFKNIQGVRDEKILPLVGATLDVKNSREWYAALMDYGTMLKKLYKNPSRKSAHYVRQPSFEGSLRQIRGKIVASLIARERVTPHALARITDSSQKRLREAIDSLKRDSLVVEANGLISLA